MDVNLNQDHYRRIYLKTMDNFICFLAHWELTYKCNLRCRHCYVAGQNREEFSYAKAKYILDELKSMGCLYLTFSGGEILMCDDFFAIAGYARRQGFALRLMTNGTLIDEAKVERIKSLYPLAVDMSIYASHKDLHDGITSVNGSFDRMIKAVELLKKKNIKVVLKFLIMKENLEEFSKVKALAENLGADFLYDFCVVAKDNGSSAPLKYRLNRDQIKDFFLKNDIPLSKREQDKEALLCSVGLNSIFITPYLDVYPCIGLKLKLGNLYTQNLRDIWAHSKDLDSIRNIKISDLLQCYKCNLIGFCNRCFGLAMMENGSIIGRSDFDCSVAGVISEILTERS